MRPVNLIPSEFRSRGAGEGDPKTAWGALGVLVALLLMTVLAITEKNKATTLRDETAALQAETQRNQAKAKPVQAFNDFADEVRKRRLLIGGLAASRFPWDTALKNLSDSTPADVTLDQIDAKTAGGASTAGATPAAANVATVELTGCSGSWIGLSRFIVRLREMPGVDKVTSSSGSVSAAEADAGGGSADSASATSGSDANRLENCGPQPLKFQVKVTYKERKIDLVGLPRLAAAGSGGATGATGAAPAASPAAASTPSPSTGAVK